MFLKKVTTESPDYNHLLEQSREAEANSMRMSRIPWEFLRAQYNMLEVGGFLTWPRSMKTIPILKGDLRRGGLSERDFQLFGRKEGDVSFVVLRRMSTKELLTRKKK